MRDFPSLQHVRAYLRDEAFVGPMQLLSGDRILMGDAELLFVARCGETFDWQDDS